MEAVSHTTTILLSPTAHILSVIVLDMSDPEIGINSTKVLNEMLGDLLAVAKEIRDLMRQKADQEKLQELGEAAPHSDESPEVADATTQEILETDTANEDTAYANELSPLDADATTLNSLDSDLASTDTDDEMYVLDYENPYGSNESIYDWPGEETVAKYKERCARHKSECKKMQVELGCFIAHLGFVGGDKSVTEGAERIRNGLLDPVECLEKAFDVTPDGRPEAISDIRTSFNRLHSYINDFAWSSHQKDVAYPSKVKQWKSIALSGWEKIDDLVRVGKFDECFEFIYCEFIYNMEAAMGGVSEALMAFEEKTASEGLAMQKIGDSEKWCAEYLSLVLPPVDEIRELGVWPEPDEIEHVGIRLANHRMLCCQMTAELDHLISHYIMIGGDKVVIEATMLLKEELFSHIQYLEKAIQWRPKDFRTRMCDVVKRLLSAVIRFQSSLYHQKHAFYFRKIKQWVTCTWIGALRILSLLRHGEVSRCISYIHHTFLSEFERAMIGIAHGDQVKPEENPLYAVPEELKTFGKESLPKFLVDQMERDTTRYVNLTTIATFFSSVTATTLQFTYAPLQTEASDSLRGVVNLFWFLSLVFSVSSGVNSLLGLTWRKSSIYDTRVPPWLIHMWFDKAPIMFLIIAAISFIIGLDLFAYLSIQPRYVSFVTSILTGLHGMCILPVTLWFLYQLKYDSVWARWIRIGKEWIIAGMKWIKTGMKWVWKMVKRPCDKYKRNKLHLLRNIFWAFGVENRVARLNYRLHWEDDWPEPYLISKLIRRIVYPIKKGLLVTKKSLFNLVCSIRKHICLSSPIKCTEDDVELGEKDGRKQFEVPEDTFSRSPAEIAKDEFRRSMQKIFTEALWMDNIMDNIKYWEFEPEGSAERWLEKKLWGYPHLVKELQDRVRPALVEARERRDREWRQGMSTEHVRGNDSTPAPAVVGRDEDDTTSIPPRPSQTVPLDDGPGPCDARKGDAQQDSIAQQYDPPPPPDEHPLFTASAYTEALEPTFRDSDLPLDAPRIEEGTTSTKKIVEWHI